MSEHQFQGDPHLNEDLIHEDPLTELARIVTGEEAAPPAVAPAPHVNQEPVVPQTAVVEPAAPPAYTPMEAPVSNPGMSGVPEVAMDLESQLMAELGALDAPTQQETNPPQAWDAPASEMPSEADSKVPANVPPVEEPSFETLLEQQLVQGSLQNEPVPQQTPLEQQNAHVEQGAPSIDPLGDGAIHSAPPTLATVDDENSIAAQQSLEEMDFSAAFDSELQLAGTDTQVDQGLDALENFAAQHPILPVDEPNTQEPLFQFQAGPGISAQEQKIDDSVHKIQNDLVDDLNIEDAFSDAFADEISIELNQRVDDAAVQEPPLTPVDAPVASDPMAVEYSDQIPEQLPLSSLAIDNEMPLEQEEPPVIIAPSRSNSGFRMAAIALGLAVIAGGVVVGYGIVSEPSDNGEPILIRADSTDFKVKPEKPGGKKIANQDQPVYDAVAGDKSTDAKQESLITASEEPVNVVRSVVPQRPEKSDVRLGNGVKDDVKNAAVAVMQPRKVKTVTVRADGTIVTSAADPVANLPSSLKSALDTATTKSVDDETTIDGASTTGLIAVPVVNPNLRENSIVTALVKPVEPVVRNVTTRAVPVVSTPVVTPAPVATPKPASITPAAPTAVTVPVPPGGYVVQISSQRSFEAAEATYLNLKRRFASLLADQPKEIREAKVDGKGTFYRVRIPQGTKSDANNFCSRYKSAGGSCFVTK